jgi:c(7)-type cytochrome triheme protein
MIRRWTILAFLILVALPSVLYGRWIKDQVYLQTDNVGKVEFSHFSHMEEESIGKNCPTCHNEPFHIVTKKNPAFTMQEMSEGKSCGVCHNGKKAFGVGGDCTTCHAGDVEINYGEAEKVVFSHDVHSEMFECEECHSDIFVPERNANPVGMKKMEDGESCGACHDGDTAFGVKSDCGSCHQGAEDIAIKSTVGDILFSHDVHTEMFGCDECHPDTFRAKANSNQVGMQKMESGESCGVCHDGDTAFGVADDCTTCHVAVDELMIKTEDVGGVSFSHEIHTEMFGCGECHPDTFKAQANSNQVGMEKMEAGESCGACHDGDTAFGVNEDCASCHAGDISYVNEDAGNITFPHAAHTDMFGCDECHPDLFKAKRGANKATMEAMEDGESCGACHDGDTAFGVAEDCESCHEM